MSDRRAAGLLLLAVGIGAAALAGLQRGVPPELRDRVTFTHWAGGFLLLLLLAALVCAPIFIANALDRLQGRD